MQTVVLTIIFFASAANQELMTNVEVSDMRTCREIADRWSSYREGMLRVLSATCEPSANLRLNELQHCECPETEPRVTLLE